MFDTTDDHQHDLVQETPTQLELPIPRSRAGFYGVSHNPKRGKYIAQVCAFKKVHYVGQYDTAIEAARAYDARSRQLLGETKRVNFPLSGAAFDAPVVRASGRKRGSKNKPKAQAAPVPSGVVQAIDGLAQLLKIKQFLSSLSTAQNELLFNLHS